MNRKRGKRSRSNSISFWCLLIPASCIITCGVIFAGVVIIDELFGSHTKVAYTGSLTREYDDSMPGAYCYEHDGDNRALVGISEGGGPAQAEGFINLYFPVNPSTGTFPFFESGLMTDGYLAYKHDFGISGWLYGSNGALEVHSRYLKEGTITLKSIQKGWQKRLKGSFEIILEDKHKGMEVRVRGSFDIATAGKDLDCLE